MKIGFDAKRLFNNFTGLGNYSRSLVKDLIRLEKSARFYLYTPKLKENNETKIFINEKIDSGDIILQEKLAIYEHDNFESLYKKLKKMSNEFITKTIELIVEENITTQKQQTVKNLRKVIITFVGLGVLKIFLTSLKSLRIL